MTNLSWVASTLFLKVRSERFLVGFSKDGRISDIAGAFIYPTVYSVEKHSGNDI